MQNLLQSIGAGEFGLVEFFVSVLFSLVAGTVCMFLYRVYFSRTFDRNESLGRSLVLIAPSVTSIFWAIQYSLPLSLGLLGALSFVRYRTPIKKSEDIAFILLVIAISLLSSIYRFFAAGMLISVVVLVILAKAILIDKYLPILKPGTYMTAFVSTQADNIETVDASIRKALLQGFDNLTHKNVTLNDVVQKDNGHNLRYSIYFKQFNELAVSRVSAMLDKLEDLERTEVFLGKIV
jgi:hypothetical protein